MPTLLLLLTWALAFTPAVFLAVVYHRLPAQVPLHWGITLEPDWVGPKRALWIVAVATALPVALISLIGMSPGRGYHGPTSPESFALMRTAIAANMAAVGVAAICLSAGYIRIRSFLLVVLGLSAVVVLGITQLR